MKIPPTPDNNVRFLPSGADRDPNGNFYDQDQNKDQQKKRRAQNPYAPKPAEEPARIQVTDENVSAAMATFQAEQQTRAQGIAAEVQGSGPGLRVVLKDGNGATIRSLSGEEFLRLHEATHDVRVAGKIFDQKA